MTAALSGMPARRVGGERPRMNVRDCPCGYTDLRMRCYSIWYAAPTVADGRPYALRAGPVLDGGQRSITLARHLWAAAPFLIVGW
jgi:hypothetical protein